MKTVFVFNTENEVIFSATKKAHVLRKYGPTYKILEQHIITGKLWHGKYYFSYDPNFKKPFIPKIHSVKEKSTEILNPGNNLEEKKLQRNIAMRVLEAAKAMNKPVVYISPKIAVRRSLEREFAKESFVR